MANFKKGINAILANNHIYLPQFGAKAKLEILNKLLPLYEVQ